jgi:hypothetical protein
LCFSGSSSSTSSSKASRTQNCSRAAVLSAAVAVLQLCSHLVATTAVLSTYSNSSSSSVNPKDASVARYSSCCSGVFKPRTQWASRHSCGQRNSKLHVLTETYHFILLPSFTTLPVDPITVWCRWGQLHQQTQLKIKP